MVSGARFCFLAKANKRSVSEEPNSTAFSIADKFKLPIRYIGTGEGIDDLREFNAKEFIDALFSNEDDSKDEN